MMTSYLDYLFHAALPRLNTDEAGRAMCEKLFAAMQDTQRENPPVAFETLGHLIVRLEDSQQVQLSLEAAPERPNDNYQVPIAVGTRGRDTLPGAVKQADGAVGF